MTRTDFLFYEKCGILTVVETDKVIFSSIGDVDFDFNLNALVQYNHRGCYLLMRVIDQVKILQYCSSNQSF